MHTKSAPDTRAVSISAEADPYQYDIEYSTRQWRCPARSAQARGMPAPWRLVLYVHTIPTAKPQTNEICETSLSIILLGTMKSFSTESRIISWVYQ